MTLTASLVTSQIPSNSRLRAQFNVEQSYLELEYDLARSFVTSGTIGDRRRFRDRHIVLAVVT
jgi:hypothetical protein